MATRINNSITLEHEDALTIAKLLAEYARDQFAHAKRTKSAPVRDICRCDGVIAQTFADTITKGLWTWK
jgi:hypothetical protein